jgi:hypothetical protein
MNTDAQADGARACNTILSLYSVHSASGVVSGRFVYVAALLWSGLEWLEEGLLVARISALYISTGTAKQAEVTGFPLCP